MDVEASWRLWMHVSNGFLYPRGVLDVSCPRGIVLFWPPVAPAVGSSLRPRLIVRLYSWCGQDGAGNNRR